MLAIFHRVFSDSLGIKFEFEKPLNTVLEGFRSLLAKCDSR